MTARVVVHAEEANASWTVHDHRGTKICDAPCEAPIGEGLQLRRADDLERSITINAWEAPAGKFEAAIEKPSRNWLGPILLGATSAVALGLAPFFLVQEACSYAVVGGGGACNHPAETEGVTLLVLGGTGVAIAGIWALLNPPRDTVTLRRIE